MGGRSYISFSRTAIYTKTKDAICTNIFKDKRSHMTTSANSNTRKYTSNHVHVFMLEAQPKRGRSHRQRGRNHRQKLTLNSCLAKT